KMLARAAESIGMAGVHPHLLRHATGFKLVNQGVDTRTLAAYLGHRQIANTARYTKMDARRFDGFWQDLRGRGAGGLPDAGGRRGSRARRKFQEQRLAEPGSIEAPTADE